VVTNTHHACEQSLITAEGDRIFDQNRFSAPPSPLTGLNALNGTPLFSSQNNMTRVKQYCYRYAHLTNASFTADPRRDKIMDGSGHTLDVDTAHKV